MTAQKSSAAAEHQSELVLSSYLTNRNWGDRNKHYKETDDRPQSYATTSQRLLYMAQKRNTYIGENTHFLTKTPDVDPT